MAQKPRAGLKKQGKDGNLVEMTQKPWLCGRAALQQPPTQHPLENGIYNSEYFQERKTY